MIFQIDDIGSTEQARHIHSKRQPSSRTTGKHSVGTPGTVSTVKNSQLRFALAWTCHSCMPMTHSSGVLAAQQLINPPGGFYKPRPRLWKQPKREPIGKQNKASTVSVQCLLPSLNDGFALAYVKRHNTGSTGTFEQSVALLWKLWGSRTCLYISPQTSFRTFLVTKPSGIIIYKRFLNRKF